MARSRTWLATSLKQPHKFIQYNTIIPVDLSDLRIRFYTESSLVYQPSSELRGRTPASDRPPIPALQVYSRPEQEVTVGGAYQSVQSLRV